MDFWKQIFGNKSSGVSKRLSSQQCAAAAAVFGEAPPVCGPKQVDYQELGAQAYKAISDEIGLDKIFEGIWASLADIQEEILIFDEWRKQYESWQFEQNFFTPRGVKAMYGDNWPIGAYRTKETSKELEPTDWIDNLAHTAAKDKRPEPQSKNYYTRHDLRMGKLRGQYKLP